MNSLVKQADCKVLVFGVGVTEDNPVYHRDQPLFLLLADGWVAMLPVTSELRAPKTRR